MSASEDTPATTAPEGSAPPRQARRDPLAGVVDALRTRKGLRRGLSVLSVVLLLGGIAALGYPFFTNLYQDRVQSRLSRELASPELEQRYREGRLQEGDSLTRIVIAKLKVDVVVVEGTSGSALRAGAGHYVDTPLPCETGNVAIAGHRTTYGKPFANIDQLQPGDQIVLETPIGSCVYEVSQPPFVTHPRDFSVIAPTPDATLTLTTCHPRHSARQRLIVKARLVSSSPDAA
jgi:sortase A